MARVARIFFDLLAQPANVHADGLLFAFEVVAPHLIEQRLTRDDAAVVFHQHAKQRELLRRKRNALAAHGELLTRWIEHDFSERDRLFMAALNRRLTTQARLYAREKLVQR